MDIIFLLFSVAVLIASVILLIIRVNRLENQVKELSDIAAHTARILDKEITLQRYNDPACGYIQYLKGVDGKLIPVPPPPTETPDNTAEPKS